MAKKHRKAFRWRYPKLPSHLYEPAKELRSIMDSLHEEGVLCPGCGQRVKEYRYAITGKMAAGLSWLVRRTEDNGGRWIHVNKVAPKWLVAGPEFARLERWKFIERKPNTDDRKRSSGKWRATALGAAFMRGRLKVPRFVRIYNEVTVQFDGEQVAFKDCLGKRFDLVEAMTGVYDDLERLPR